MKMWKRFLERRRRDRELRAELRAEHIRYQEEREAERMEIAKRTNTILLHGIDSGYNGPMFECNECVARVAWPTDHYRWHQLLNEKLDNPIHVSFLQ